MTTAKTIDARVRTNDGHAIPWLGLGVWQTHKGAETFDAVRDALAAGYRHIDTARAYGNEADVGRAVRASGIPRSEIYVTTKLWNADQGYEQAKRAFDRSLASLGLDYVDLFLLHWPERARHDSWRALIELRESGKARSIGVSNFTIDHLEKLRRASDVVPAINQVELHPFLTQPALREHCAKHGIVIEAYSPLAHGQRLDHPAITRLAKKLGKTPAQIMIRWALDHDLVVLPKSSKKARILENAAVFDFALSPEDLRALDALDENLRTCWDPTGVP